MNHEKKKSGNQFPVAEFIQDSNRKVLGPGGGAGIGCSIGASFVLVGRAGNGGWPWNQFKVVFGVGVGGGMGCGFGHGHGYGISLDSLHSQMFKKRLDSNKKGTLIAI